MFHYLFTNDLRISHLQDFLINAARHFRNDTIPSASEDKNAYNNINTLGFYFNLTKNSNCTKVCCEGNVRKVVFNFIKKFQFPNPRTKESLDNSFNDEICLAPLRIIIKFLLIMEIESPSNAFLSIPEILRHIFCNESVAKSQYDDIQRVISIIIHDRRRRREDENLDFPDDNTLEELYGCYWKQCERQIRELVKVLCWSGCVVEDEKKNIRLQYRDLSENEKAEIFDVVTYSKSWKPDTSKSFEENKRSYQSYMDIEYDENNDTQQTERRRPLIFCTQLSSEFLCERIIFGAPGTGKSFRIEQNRMSLLGEDNEDNYERVTFHPDYSYANFVGTYKPVPCEDIDGSNIVTYEYVPGPFMRLYAKALKNAQTDDPRPYLLIIEEINRANVAAVFGDLFQLLDRDDYGVSEYPIQASEDVKKYLAGAIGEDPECYNTLRLPNNMFIWATMNSADQGVFPMDTAFKRRWDFTYLGIDDNDEDIRGKYVTIASGEGQRLEWNSLRKAINNFLADRNINEDKQLGPYFISRNIVVPSDGGNEIDSVEFCRVFKNKVLMYLFEDAARQKRTDLFKGVERGNNRYSEICKAFDEKGVRIFNESIYNEVEITEPLADEP